MYIYKYIHLYTIAKRAVDISDPGSAASGTSPFKAPRSGELAELVHSPEEWWNWAQGIHQRGLQMTSHTLGLGSAHLVKINSFCISSFV